MSKGRAQLKGVVKCTVLRVGRIVPLARERSHVILVRHIVDASNLFARALVIGATTDNTIYANYEVKTTAVNWATTVRS